MSTGDILGLIFSYIYAISLLLLAETLYRRKPRILAHLFFPKEQLGRMQALKSVQSTLEATPTTKEADLYYVLTRKIIHIGAGMWIWVILLLFDHWWLAIIPTATFILFNAPFLRFHIFSAMDPKEGATPGTVYSASVLASTAIPSQVVESKNAPSRVHSPDLSFRSPRSQSHWPSSSRLASHSSCWPHSSWPL